MLEVLCSEIPMDALDEAAQMASEPNVWMSIGAAASTAGVQV